MSAAGANRLRSAVYLFLLLFPDVDIWYALNGSQHIHILKKKCFPDETNYAIAPSPPFDSISSIRYSPSNPHQLLVSAWDAVSQFVRFWGFKNLLSFIALDCEIL